MVLICVIAAVAFIANFIIKGLFTKDRPCDLDETVDLLIRRPLGSSLPSGHSASSFACVVVIFHMNPWWGGGSTYMGIAHCIFADISVCAFSVGCAVRGNIGDNYRTYRHAGCDTFYRVVIGTRDQTPVPLPGQGSGPGVPQNK